MCEPAKNIVPDNKNLHTLHTDKNNLSKTIDDLNAIIDSKNRYIQKSKKELKQLEQLYNLVNDFDYLPIDIYSIEAKIKELEVVINVESLNKKLLQRIKHKKQTLEREKRFIIYIYNFINRILKQNEN